MVDEDRNLHGRVQLDNGKINQPNLRRRRDWLGGIHLEAPLKSRPEEETTYKDMLTSYTPIEFQEVEVEDILSNLLLDERDLEMTRMRASGMPLLKIANEFGLTESRVSQIFTGKIARAFRAAGFDV